jgi:hypothetical protein
MVRLNQGIEKHYRVRGKLCCIKPDQSRTRSVDESFTWCRLPVVPLSAIRDDDNQ